MKAFILILLLSVRALGSAPLIDPKIYVNSDWESLKAQALVKPATATELSVRLTELRRLKSLRELCDGQLRDRRVPVSCFELLNAEKKNNVLNQHGWAENFERIDVLCVRNVRAIQDLHTDQFGLHLPVSKCRDEMKSQLEKLRYSSAFRDPQAVFSVRHQF